MQRWIDVFSQLEHPENNVNKFTHHRPDNEFGRLTRSRQAFVEAYAPSGFEQGNHGKHVKRFAQEGMADL